MEDFKPFSKLPIIRYFQHDLEKIKMAYRLSDSIRSDLKNIRAAGDEVEFAVKDFFKNKLFPKYHVNDGHIIDSQLKISPQYDIIICENSKNPVLFNLSDKSELFYFETVYCFGEVKRSFYKKSLLLDFCSNIGRTKKELLRDKIPSNFIESGNSGFQIEEPLSSLPLRNPLLSFLFFINTDNSSFTHIGEILKNLNKHELPNFIVFLDQGLIVNVNKSLFENEGIIKINLYPEYQDEDNIWVLMAMDEENNVLTYQYMLIVEHLNNSLSLTPNLHEYTKNMFDFSISNFHKL
ncbi:MAG: DUF6602 domain-containing protein [Candidatus Cyclobacteriaceae bacterium M2_1C_046]